MSKMSKAIAVLGVVAGLGVAALPLSSYAADNYSQTAQAQVQVEVGGAISITVDNGDTTVGADTSLVDLGDLKINGVSATKDLDVTVSSNSEIGYDLTIKSLTSETALVNENGAKIPADANVVAGTSAWAYRTYQADGTTPNAWTAITDTGVNIASHTAASGDAAMSETTKVNFGASASGTQQEGTYKQTVVFTATVK